jgi:hypothetical protein
MGGSGGDAARGACGIGGAGDGARVPLGAQEPRVGNFAALLTVVPCSGSLSVSGYDRVLVASRDFVSSDSLKRGNFCEIGYWVVEYWHGSQDTSILLFCFPNRNRARVVCFAIALCDG